MNEVDLSDQYRSYYNTQLTVFRTWMPLFFWILDTTIINAYRIYKAQGGTLSHQDFRNELAWTLASEGNMNDPQNPKATRQHNQKQDDHEASKSIVYVTQSMPDLPAIRLLNKGMHYPHADQMNKSHPNCILCCYKATTLKDENFKAKTPTPWSSHCSQPSYLRSLFD
ncbi:hypothetical protein CPB97_000586 [Podila verticillata]|nr:hypothetical protein CPB97_000586 [Podila verticillata]